MSKGSLVRRPSDDRQLEGLVMATIEALANAATEPCGYPARTEGPGADESLCNEARERVVGSKQRRS